MTLSGERATPDLYGLMVRPLDVAPFSWSMTRIVPCFDLTSLLTAQHATTKAMMKTMPPATHTPMMSGMDQLLSSSSSTTARGVVRTTGYRPVCQSKHTVVFFHNNGLVFTVPGEAAAEYTCSIVAYVVRHTYTAQCGRHLLWRFSERGIPHIR